MTSVCLFGLSHVAFCQWISQNLAAVGLAISFFGTVLMSGTKLQPTRSFGVWLFPEYRKRVKGYRTLVQNGEILPDEEGFNELRTALFPTGEDKIFSSPDDQKAENLFSDQSVDPVKIKKEEFKLERIDDNSFPPERREPPGGPVNSKHTVTISELHYIADKRPNVSNINAHRKLRRPYDDVDEELESKFEDAMLYFGLQVLGFGILIQLISVSGII